MSACPRCRTPITGTPDRCSLCGESLAVAWWANPAPAPTPVAAAAAPKPASQPSFNLPSQPAPAPTPAAFPKPAPGPAVLARVSAAYRAVAAKIEHHSGSATPSCAAG